MGDSRHRLGATQLSRIGATKRLVQFCAALIIVTATGTNAQQIGSELAARLTEAQQRSYVYYLRSRSAFEMELQAYWIAVDQKREQRKRKRSQGLAFLLDDYIGDQPPKYEGPALDPTIAAITADTRPSEPEPPRPAVAEFVAAAWSEYGFVPTPTTEREFKRRYASEALAAGLTPEQVVRVYALETGGRGTYDMQAGIDPETRKGKPISSALGYAQLLNANSISELIKHGDGFASRLASMAAAPSVSGVRAGQLRAKIVALRKMQRAARAVPNEWSQHVKLGNTPKGLGIHALNLDADIGPWLQVIKLKGLQEEAARSGRAQLSGAEIELLNLAGPRTGLEMMEPVARGMPTANFFSQAGYYRNTIVREKSAAQLLDSLNERMEQGLKKTGSIEFAQAFEEVGKLRRSLAGR